MTTTFPFDGTIKLKDAALVYIAEGFSIIPLHWISGGQCSCGKSDCSSPAKHPLTQHGLKDASKDLDQIKKWWKAFPKANIGVCTGDVSGGLVVVDFDHKTMGITYDDFMLYEAPQYPKTLTTVTGAGVHFWFRSTTDIRNSAGKLGKGIDIRGSGGYVVAPPSVHFSGKTYAFVNQEPIAELPDDLLAKLTEPEPEQEDQDLTLSYSPDIADFAPEGSRNNLLTSIGGKLRRQGFSSQEIESTLIAANQNRCQPPLPDREVRKIAQSVGRYIPAEQIETGVTDQELDLDSDIDPDSVNTQTQPDDQSIPDLFTDLSGRDPLLGIITTDQLRTTVFGTPEMTLQGLFKSDWGLLIGIGSVGKSAFLFNVCMCLASGRPFPPVIPEGQPPRRVLYLDFEGSEWRSQALVEKLSEVLTDDESRLVGQNLHWGIEPEVNGRPWRMNDVHSLKNLAAYIKQHKIDLVIVDTVSQATGLKDENNNAEVGQKIILPIRRLTKHCDIAALLVHHEGRGKTQNKEHDMQYRGRGATALMDASRYQIAMIPFDPDKRGPVKIANTKKKGFGFEEVVMTLDEETRWFSLTNAPPPPPAQPPPKVEDMILHVLDMADDPEVTTDEIQTMLIGVPKRTVTAKLTELVKAKRIIKVRHGVYQAVSTLQDDPGNAPEDEDNSVNQIDWNTPLED